MNLSISKHNKSNEILRKERRVLYHLPEKDALGLANYSEAGKIRWEQDQKRMNRSLRRFRRIAANSKNLRTAGPPPG